MMIRFFDLLFSILGLIVLIPVFMVVYILIRLETKGSGFYTQIRTGKNGRDFKLYKFRSMYINNGSDSFSVLTFGKDDARITKVGKFIRLYKIDELPQLFNVLIGDMSLVGPRPECRKYIEIYGKEQQKILSVRPGITDYASIYFIDEHKLLGESDNPEKTYIEVILPEKIKHKMLYVSNYSVKEYFKILFLTMVKLVKNLINIEKTVHNA